VVLAFTAVACGDDGGEPRRPAAEVELPDDVHGVGVVSTEVDVGPSIGAPVPTTVFYPAQTPFGEPARQGAAAAADEGPYPLVVFVHGAGNSAATYRVLLEAVASRGYVVAAPTFPESSDPQVVGSDRALQLAEPQALALPAVIERVRAEGIGGVPTASLLTPDQLHLVGHSLGSATVLSTAFNTCCRIEGVTSVTGMSSVLLETSGEYHLEGTPVLYVHGQLDDVIPVGQAEFAYQESAAPRYLVELAGAGHFEYVLPNSPAYGSLVLAVTAMLEGSSGGRPTPELLEEIASQVEGVQLLAEP
jgi:pimeloyl-ACP methyl ester carboxylesterase